MMWIMAETTCIFLVFCVPTFPKVFAKSGIVSQIGTLLRTWTRLGANPPSDPSDKSREWPPTIGSVITKPRRVANPLSTTEHGTQGHGSSIELTAMPESYTEYGKDADKSSLDPGIVRTVEFDTQDDAASKTSTTGIMDRQHPWMAQ